MAQIYLIGYDIADNKRRRAVYKLLLRYRVAGQKSFFECLLTRKELDEICSYLTYLINPDTDRIHVFQLNPQHKVEIFGVANSYMGFFMVN